MSDTISKDPARVAEAQRLAQTSKTEFPKLPYDPKAVAREEFERIVDPHVFTESFEEFWWGITSEDPSSTCTELLTSFTEAEFRSMVDSFVYVAHAYFLQRALTAANERAAVAKKSTIFSCTDRLKLGPGVPLWPDIRRGLLWKRGAEHCPVHPNGCPPAEELTSLLGALLGVKP